MDIGISIYPGLDNSLEENLQLMHEAARLGMKRVFTSFHIPETDTEAFRQDIGNIMGCARELGLEMISDISPATCELLGIGQEDLEAYAKLGIHTLRLDYGYGAETIARLSRNAYDIKIQLNASTITEEFIQELHQAEADFGQIDALHNFYPREGTGLSEEFFCKKNSLLHRAGIKIGAFVPSSQGRRRSPLQAGLPTLEEHRQYTTDLASRHLAALEVDFIIISDSLPTNEELQQLAMLGKDKEPIVHIKARLHSKNPEIARLLSQPLTARLDEARDAIRAQEGRPLVKKMELSISPENTIERKSGDITLDNEGYGRYMGELQILKNPLPPDPRTNIVATVLPEEIFLLKYIPPGRRFQLRLGE